MKSAPNESSDQSRSATLGVAGFADPSSAPPWSSTSIERGPVVVISVRCVVSPIAYTESTPISVMAGHWSGAASFNASWQPRRNTEAPRTLSGTLRKTTGRPG
ncbi:MAG: hypothetical protein ABIX28_19050 [Vicinamibacterales bacterium]